MSWRQIARNALHSRCPGCGQGPLFDGFLTVRPKCEICGLKLSGHDSGDGPAVFLIFILGFTIVPLALWVDAAFTPPIWVHALLWPALVVGGAVGLLRPAKALTVALQYQFRRGQMS